MTENNGVSRYFRELDSCGKVVWEGWATGLELKNRYEGSKNKFQERIFNDWSRVIF